MLFPVPRAPWKRFELRALRWSIAARSWFWSAAEKTSTAKWSETNLFWGGMGAVLAILLIVLAAMLKDLRWLLLLAWPFSIVAVWAWIRSTFQPRGLRLVLTCVGALVAGAVLLAVNAKVKPSFDVSLAMVTTIHRMRDPNGVYMRGGQNDLVGVLCVRQRNGVSARHVGSLQVVGDVSADFNSYMAAFAKGDGTESVDDIEATYTELRPYFQISWIVFPATQVRVDPNDEDFIKFNISQSSGTPAFLYDPKTGSPKDYFGFDSRKQPPKYLMTTPVWSELVRFTAINPADSTGIYPALRDEVKSGKVKVQVDIDGEMIAIPVREMRFPWAVSLDDGVQAKMLPQDMFYGIDHGSRTSIPTPRDPLVK